MATPGKYRHSQHCRRFESFRNGLCFDAARNLFGRFDIDCNLDRPAHHPHRIIFRAVFPFQRVQ